MTQYTKVSNGSCGSFLNSRFGCDFKSVKSWDRYKLDWKLRRSFRFCFSWLAANTYRKIKNMTTSMPAMIDCPSKVLNTIYSRCDRSIDIVNYMCFRSEWKQKMIILSSDLRFLKDIFHDWPDAHSYHWRFSPSNPLRPDTHYEELLLIRV